MNILIIYFCINFGVTLTIIDQVNFDETYRMFLNKLYLKGRNMIGIYGIIILLLFGSLFIVYSYLQHIYYIIKNNND